MPILYDGVLAPVYLSHGHSTPFKIEEWNFKECILVYKCNRKALGVPFTEQYANTTLKPFVSPSLNNMTIDI